MCWNKYIHILSIIWRTIGDCGVSNKIIDGWMNGWFHLNLTQWLLSQGADDWDVLSCCDQSCNTHSWRVLQLQFITDPQRHRPSLSAHYQDSEVMQRDDRRKSVGGKNNKVDNYHKLRQSVRAVSEGARQLVQRLMHDFHFGGLNDCLLCQFPAAITSESSFHCSISGSQFLLFVIGSNAWDVWCFRAFECI